ncbi:MAG: hypothetical protein JWN24_75 [Phycisphaerales bacterium]|nr:hypothetical protein [Phycisphaerales bacterium]
MWHSRPRLCLFLSACGGTTAGGGCATWLRSYTRPGLKMATPLEFQLYISCSPRQRRTDGSPFVGMEGL